MKTIATGLSAKGRRALAQFLADNISDDALKALVAEFERDIVFGRNGNLRGDLEIEARYSVTKRPETTWFEGDEIVTEEVEDEDED